MSDPIRKPDEFPSRSESILSDTIGLEGYSIETPSRSRIETLLIELKEIIGQGGGSSTAYATSLEITMDEYFVMSATLKNKDGDTLGQVQTVDLPLESVVVNGSYDSINKNVVLTLENGNTVSFSVADLVSGLQTEITSNNKLDADLVDDSTSTNKFVTSSDKTAWNGKQDALTFDDSPTQNSTNPVKSGGVYSALSGKADAADIPVAGTSTPIMDGVGSAGSATTWSKSDHVHPSDTTKQNVIDNNHKLSADLVADINSTNKFNMQPDWNQTTNSAGDFIKNKPTLGTAAAAATTDFAPASHNQASNTINAMTGYTAPVNPSTWETVAATDTLNEAVQKLDNNSEINKNNISLLCDANGKKQLIPNFGILTNGSVTYTHNSDSTITITGSKGAGTENYVDIVQKSYEDYGLKSGDTIQVVNRDSAPVILAIIFTSSTSASSPNYTLNGTNTYTLPENYTGFRIRLSLTVSSTNVNVTINPLVCNKALYDISSAITPYSMSNAELTAKEQSNENNILLNRHYGVKNIFIPTAGNLSNPSGFTGTITRNADNSYTINGSTGGDVYYLQLGRIKMPVGTFVLYARPTNKTGIFVYNDGDWADNDDSRYKTFSQPSSQGIFLRIAANQTLENYTIYPMICDLTAWNMSRDYERGALSNAELTEEVNTAKNNISTLLNVKRVYKVPISSVPVNSIYFGVQMFPYELASTSGLAIEVKNVGQGGVAIDPSKFKTQINTWGFRIYTTDSAYAGLIPDVEIKTST